MGPTSTKSTSNDGTGRATVRVKVGDLPLCPDIFTALGGSTGNQFDVSANDAIRPATAETFHLLDAGGATMGGSVSVADGMVTYSPNPAYAGSYPYTEIFAYRVQDDSGNTVDTVASVNVYAAGSDRDTGQVTVTASRTTLLLRSQKRQRTAALHDLAAVLMARSQS